MTRKEHVYEKPTQNVLSPRRPLGPPYKSWRRVRIELFLWLYRPGAVDEYRGLLLLGPDRPQDAWRSGSDA